MAVLEFVDQVEYLILLELGILLAKFYRLHLGQYNWYLEGNGSSDNIFRLSRY